MIKLVSIVGARPQFIKLSPIVNSINENFSDYFQHFIIHTGQHFSNNMSDDVFENLNLPKANYNLNINKLNHCEMISSMLNVLPSLIKNIDPDYILLYGDTNSTLAGAIASLKLNKKIAHIEAGVRSYDMTMPEEQNRVITDRLANLLFVPCLTAIENLRKEGINLNNVIYSGDLMLDSFKSNIQIIDSNKFLINYQLKKNSFNYLTIHRESNLSVDSLKKIFYIISKIQKLFIFPIHPNTKKTLEGLNLKTPNNIKVIDPLLYTDSLAAIVNCDKVFTDSGGVQREAYFAQKNCIVLRKETEWIDLIKCGQSKLYMDVNTNLSNKFNLDILGEGKSASKILTTILNG